MEDKDNPGESLGAWMSLSKARDLADYILKIGAVVAILGIGAAFIRRPDVVQLQDFYQSFIDPSVASREFAARGTPFPDAFQVLVKEYNARNQADLANMLDTTETRDSVSEICRKFKEDAEAAFGHGFCHEPDRPSYWRSLRYHGRAYERGLVRINNEGWTEADGGQVLIGPPRLPGPQLHAAVDALHAAEYAMASILVHNRGHADAIRVKLLPPNGYNRPLTDGSPFTLRPGQMATRWFETERGSEPIREGRQFQVGWDNGRAELSRSEQWVVAVIVGAGFVSVVVFDFWTHRFAARRTDTSAGHREEEST